MQSSVGSPRIYSIPVANDTNFRSPFECLDAAVRKVYWHERIAVAARTLWPSFLFFADRTSMVQDVRRARQWLHVFHEAMEHLEELALERPRFVCGTVRLVNARKCIEVAATVV